MESGRETDLRLCGVDGDELQSLLSGIVPSGRARVETYQGDEELEEGRRARPERNGPIRDKREAERAREHERRGDETVGKEERDWTVEAVLALADKDRALFEVGGYASDAILDSFSIRWGIH